MPFKLGIYLRRIIYKPFFKGFGRNIRIMDAVVIKYPDEISIGDNVTINQFCYILGLGGLSIGNDVMMGSGAKITTTIHNSRKTDIPMLCQGLTSDSIIIGDDIWIGFNVVILGGSNIQKGSILAANTVVNSKIFEPFSIIAGVPAKVIGKRK